MKAYVQSGNVHQVVISDSPMECAKLAFLKQASTEIGLRPGQIVSISETGFDSDNDEDLFMLSETVMDHLILEEKIERKS